MKISFDVDCTPEEARRLMGLPDLTPIHEIYLDRVKDMMSGGISSEALEAMTKGWTPMGEAGFALWRRLIEQVAKPHV